MDSPYRPGAGVAPPLLVGREDAQTRAAEVFARTANFGAPGRSPLVLTGVRGVGKTVLLQAIAEEAVRHGFLVASVTVDRRGPLAGRLAVAVAAAMAPLKPSGAVRWRRWTSALSHVSLEVSVPGVKITHPATPVKTTPGSDRDAVVMLVAESARLARSDRPGLCLAFDELQEGPEVDLAVVGALAQELVTSPLVIIGAGLPQTPERLMQAGSFAERFTFHALRLLTPQQAGAALLIPASDMAVSWDFDAAEHVLAAANGSPYLLQLYGDGAWRAAAPVPGGRIPLGAARFGVEAATAQLHDGMFRGRWNRASPLEQQYMTEMARLQAPDGTAATGQVAAALGRPTTSISFVRTRLLDKGLIQTAGHGRLAFSMPGFDRFVMQETGGQS